MRGNECSHFCINDNCHLSNYENEDKCIFHCMKTQDNGWILLDDNMDSDSYESKKSKWNGEKVQEFWREFKSYAIKQTVFEGFHIPIYWELQYNHESILNEIPSEIVFEKCIFLDCFILENSKESEYINSDFKEYLLIQGKDNEKIIKVIERDNSAFNKLELSFLNSTFHSLLKLDSLTLNRLCLLNNEHYSSNIQLSKLEIENDSEICRSIKVNNFFLEDNKVIGLFEVWNNECNTIRLESGTYENLEVKNNQLKELSLEDVTLQKMKMKDQNNINIKLNNLEFKEDSRVLFQNISCENFELKKLSQDSKFIQFDHIQITKQLTFSQNEFKNTYFNDFNIVTATKTIEKTSFMDSHLNSIEWGKISEIKALKDIFRELKFVNDSQANYINANNFYVMEMNEHEKELNEQSWVSNFWQDKLIFLLGKKISNHGQSWFLPLLWILLSSLGFYIVAFLFKIDCMEEFTHKKILWIIVLVISSVIIGRILYELGKWKKKNLYTFIHIIPIITFIIIIIFCNLGTMDNFVKFMGLKPPKEFEGVLIWWLMNKIVTGFLAYHFIISLRRQTKR